MHALHKYFIAWAIILGIAICWGTPARAEAAKRDYHDGVRIAVSSTWKPYSFLREDGKITGFLVDYWSKWSEKTGVPVEFYAASWAETIEAVYRGDADIHSGMHYTEQRALKLDFSLPLDTSKTVLLTRSEVACDIDRPNIQWGGVIGTLDIQQAQILAGDKLVRGYNTSADLFAAFSRNEIQAIVQDLAVSMLLTKELGIEENYQICRTLYEKELFASVAKENDDLLRMINGGLSQISDDERRFIFNRWFIDYQKSSGRGLFPYVMIALVVSIGVFFATTRRKR